MAKAKLTTRAISSTTVTSDNLAKASQLTHNQLDSNFINLRDATFGVVADDSSTIQVGMDSNLYIQGGSNVTTSVDSAGVVTINATGEVTASSTTTFTNKTFDADASGNALSNIEVANLKSGVLDTDLTAVAGTDTTLASAKAIKSYVDSSAGAGWRVFGDDSAGVDIAEGGSLYLRGGDNVTTSTNSDGTLTINAAAESQSVFKTISVSGQDDVVADTTTDTLTLAAGSNMTITTTAGSDTITFASGGQTGDITFTGSTISSPSNADITLEPSGTGAIVMPAITINDNNISATRSQDNLMLSSSGSGNIILDGYKVQIGDDDSTGPNPWRYYTDTNPPTIKTPNANDDLVFETTPSDPDVGGHFVFQGGGDPRVVLRSTAPTGGTHHLGPGGINGEMIIHGGGLLYENNVDRPNLFNVGWYSSKITLHSGDGFSVSSADIDLTPLGSGEVNITGGGTNITGPLTVTGTTGSAVDATIASITIRDSAISSASSNEDLELNANGSGTIILENLKIGTSGATVTTILDEDAMGSDSATALATQQSIKAFVASQIPAAGQGWRIFGDDSAGVDIAEGGSLYLRGGDNVTTSTNSDGTLTITATGDTTGDITFVGSTIISPSNADLILNPAGTGKVNINAVYTLPNADGSANQVLGTNGSGVLSFRDPTAINIDGGVADSDYTSVPTIDGGTA